MLKSLLISSALLLSGTMLACNRAAASAVAIPDPVLDEMIRNTSQKQTIVLAGGCFWGVDAVFKHVKGVTDVRSGYAGGKGSATYEEVSTGNTGYAESVQITYDPSKITYGKLLKVFFAVAHDPTEVNRQGPDTGMQYRSAIFYSTDDQKHIAQAYLDQLNKAIASRIVVLQPKATEELRPSWRKKTRVIYQSVEDKQEWTGVGSGSTNSSTKTEARTKGHFDVCVIGHLRAVKDPFRTSMAARSLPDSSRIRVLQVGGAMTDAMAKHAHREMDTNERYRWLDEQPQSRVRSILSRTTLCVLSSRIEGGANVLSEAIAASVPILASCVDGNVGILGKDYPGYFEVGNTKQLARLLARAETSPEYLAKLKTSTKGLAVLVDPSREEQAWSDLINELTK